MFEGKIPATENTGLKEPMRTSVTEGGLKEGPGGQESERIENTARKIVKRRTRVGATWKKNERRETFGNFFAFVHRLQ